ncbi:hypothetical protein LTR53_011434 [Teratosphaeriaceae sp. CCFEE 6253]|nr:hypothetical protein LTR53_011434 [Teratosphaeriaceae sp. CCFEE 6253]
MEVAGVALAIVATIDLCFKYGQELIDACGAYKHADTKVSERALRIESSWYRTSVQLNFIRQIHADLDDELQDLQVRIYEILVAKLRVATRKLNGLHKDGRNSSTKTLDWATNVKKLKFVLTRQCLDEVVEDLELWQRTFDPTWFLVLRVAKPSIDEELSKRAPTVTLLDNIRNVRDTIKEQPATATSVFLPDTPLNTATEESILYSSARCYRDTRAKRCHIVDRIPCTPESKVGSMTRDVRGLAAKLRCVEPHKFGMLQCRGVIRNVQEDKLASFDFVFRCPDGLEESPISLRALILSEVKHSLGERVKLAQQLVTAVSYVHTLCFVHKSIRPETILGFGHGTSKLGSIFLVGFERFRNADAHSMRIGDAAWEKDLYRHPERQGVHPDEDYRMQHDIYSLGVCLLEIGLWESLLTYIAGQGEPRPGVMLEQGQATLERRSPRRIKEQLVGLARHRLPRKMGDRYSDVVINCLTCLDDDNVDFATHSDFEDADGVLVGVRYIEKILMKMEDIRI